MSIESAIKAVESAKIPTGQSQRKKHRRIDAEQANTEPFLWGIFDDPLHSRKPTQLFNLIPQKL